MILLGESDACQQQVAQEEGDVLQSVLVGSLGTVEVIVLIGNHNWVFDAMFLAKLANPHHLVEVQDKGSSGSKDHIAIFWGNFNGNHD